MGAEGQDTSGKVVEDQVDIDSEMVEWAENRGNSRTSRFPPRWRRLSGRSRRSFRLRCGRQRAAGPHRCRQGMRRMRERRTPPEVGQAAINGENTRIAGLTTEWSAGDRVAGGFQGRTEFLRPAKHTNEWSILSVGPAMGKIIDATGKVTGPRSPPPPSSPRWRSVSRSTSTSSSTSSAGRNTRSRPWKRKSSPKKAERRKAPGAQRAHGNLGRPPINRYRAGN